MCTSFGTTKINDNVWPLQHAASPVGYAEKVTRTLQQMVIVQHGRPLEMPQGKIYTVLNFCLCRHLGPTRLLMHKILDGLDSPFHIREKTEMRNIQLNCPIVSAQIKVHLPMPGSVSTTSVCQRVSVTLPCSCSGKLVTSHDDVTKDTFYVLR